MVATRKIPSDCISFAYAVESSLTVLPPIAERTWRRLATTAQGTFGATVTYMTDDTIGSGRAPQKGIPVGKDVDCDFTASLRQEWLQPFLPGLFINYPLEFGTTLPLRNSRLPKTPDSATASDAKLSAITNTTTITGTGFTAANGFNSTSSTDKTLVVGEGFAQQANNGLHKITATTATTLTTTGLVAEASPPKGAKFMVCGAELDSANAQAALSGREFTLDAPALGTSGSLTVTPGTFIYIGGTAPTTRFSGANASKTGWARVSRVLTNKVVCDITTFDPTGGVTGNTNKIQVFIPTAIYRDHIDCGDERRTTYSFERRLGRADTTDQFEQSQLLSGCVVGQLELSMPTKAKAMAKLTFVGAESYRYRGDTRPVSDDATTTTDDRLPADKTSLFNTSWHIKQALIYRHDDTTAVRPPLFGLVREGTFTLNNNLEALDGWGTDGAFDVNSGQLVVTASITALFRTVEALDLAEEGIDAGMFIVFGRGTPGAGSGLVLDIPLMTVQNSPVTAAINTPLQLTLTNAGNQSDFGYVTSFQFFNHLPDPATARRPRSTT